MGLLRTAARAAVAAHVVGNVQRRQQNKWAAQDAARATAHTPAAPQSEAARIAQPQPAQVGAQGLIDQLTQLGQLRDSGVLTPEEFDAQKQRLLADG